MKKIYSIFAVVFLVSIGAFAQTATFEIKNVNNNNALVNDNDVFINTVAALATIQSDFTVKNISTSTQTITVRKYQDLLNTVSSSDLAEAVFCTGSNCYPPTVFTASMIMSPGETVIFKADLTEASVIGESNVRYKFSNAANTAEAITFTMKYNVPASIAKYSNPFNSISSVYPNPSSSKAFVNITTGSEVSNVKINIINALGSMVSSKNIDLNKGKNTISIDSEELNSGIYFVTIAHGDAMISRKITITK